MFSELLSSMYMLERAAGRQVQSELAVFASNKYQWEGTGPRVPAWHARTTLQLCHLLNYRCSSLYIICFSLFIKLTALCHAEYFKQVTFYASRDRFFSFFVLSRLVINNFISKSYFLLILEVILQFCFCFTHMCFWFFGFGVPKHTFWLCYVIRCSHYSERTYFFCKHD